MDAATFLSIATICAPLVHSSTAQAIASTESAMNPHAIGVVAGRLERQPRSLPEALATAEQLRSQGRNFSIGLTQINVHNLERLKLSVADAFDGCKNLQAMQTVLGECFGRASAGVDTQTSLRRALSCYYSGNFTTGFRQGYVGRVVSNAQRIARAPP